MGSAQSRASSTRGPARQRPTWIDQFTPTKNPLRPDIVQIVDASYQVKVPDEKRETLIDMVFPWFPWTQHYNSSSKESGICSAGPWAGNKKKAQPCRGCDQFFGLMARDPTTGQNKMGPISKRPIYSFNVIHYHPYHLVEAIDRKDGTVMVNKKTNEPFWQLQICKIENCQHCADNKMVLPARRMHWDTGTSHWNKLLERDAMLRRCCKTCGGRNTITWGAYACPNPECVHVFFEHGKTNIPEENIFRAVKDPMLCPKCGGYAWPKEYNDCSGCGDQCEPSSIFNVRLHVHRTADPVRNGTELSIDDWEEAYDGIWVPEEIAAYSKQMADDMLVPMDLSKILAPTAMEQQMKIYGGGRSAYDNAVRQPVASEYNDKPAGQ